MQVVLFAFLNIFGDGFSGIELKWKLEILDFFLVTLKCDVWSRNNGVEVDTELW